VISLADRALGSWWELSMRPDCGVEDTLSCHERIGERVRSKDTEGRASERIPRPGRRRNYGMSAVSLPAYGVRSDARLLRRLLLVAAVGQAVSSILVSTFGGAFTTADRAGEPPIVPPGWTFTIWSVIIALSIGYRSGPTLTGTLTRSSAPG
jgi:hypothetical protein